MNAQTLYKYKLFFSYLYNYLQDTEEEGRDIVKYGKYTQIYYTAVDEYKYELEEEYGREDYADAYLKAEEDYNNKVARAYNFATLLLTTI